MCLTVLQAKTNQNYIERDYTVCMIQIKIRIRKTHKFESCEITLKITCFIVIKMQTKTIYCQLMYNKLPILK